MKTILAADIGGTNSRFAHFQMGGNGALKLVGTKWLPTAEADSFAKLLEQLRGSDFTLPANEADIAVIAVAGPVEHGAYCAPPYISWDIDLSSKENKKGLPRAYLINDFVAQAYACRSPVGKSARVILAGENGAAGTIAVLGAGTALGKAILVPVPGHGFLALPSEGGHACFPFISPREFAFQEFVQEKSGQKHITGNLVVSGRGLRYIHWFLSGEDLEPKDVGARFTPASETLAWAAKFYGRVCRDYALEVLALGGLYIAGGLAAQNPEMLAHANFRGEFLNSPTMAHILAKIPVLLIDNQDSGLWGAAFLGQQIFHQC
ncbi:MAG: hypothetical protein AUK28_05865 [Desulfobacterales bacterium CG2_30_60_27]|nr:MAG: hypothetical protein AUK28_05865 [Desulfobacterales bacterium CG2_30_60_27]